MRKKIKRTILILISIAIVVVVVLCLINKYTYKKIKFDQLPDATFSSQYSNKLATVINGKLVLYDENGNRTNIDTPFNVVFACPLEESIWVINDKNNLYEVSYSSVISDVVLTNVAYINMAPNHYTAITMSGELYVWGENIGYRLGLDKEGYIDIPKRIDGIANAKETAISYGNTVVLLEDGTVYAAGEIYQKDYMEAVDNLTEFTLLNEMNGVEHLHNGGLCISQMGNKFKSWSYLYKDFDNNEYKAKEITSVDDFFDDKEVICCAVASGFTTFLTAEGDIFYWGYDFLDTPDCKCDSYAMPCQKVPYIDDVDMIYAGSDVVYARKGNDMYIIK